MRKFILSFILLLLCYNLFAQQDTTNAIGLDEVVISANKIEENKSDIPQQIDIVKASQISFHNVQTTADALQNLGGVYVQKSQMGGGSPVIRGFEANRVLLVIDGVRMNNAIYRSGHLQNSITIDPNMIERIEIINGAGSVIYGSDAMGGVMSIYTKKPVLSDSSKPNFHIRSVLRYGSANFEKTFHSDFNIGLRKAAFLTSITLSDFDDIRKGSNSLKNYPGFGDCNFYVENINDTDTLLANSNPDIQKFSGYQQLDILGKILILPNLNHYHILNFQYSASSNIPRYDRLQTFTAPMTPGFSEWYYGPQRRFLTSWEYGRSLKKKFVDYLKFIPSFQWIEESRHSRKFKNDWRDNFTEHVEIFSVNMDLYKIIRTHEIRYGAEGVYNFINSKGVSENIVTGESLLIASRYPDNSTYTTAGIYFSHRWEINSKFILSDGVRFSYVDLKSAFDTTFFKYEKTNVHQQSSSVNFNLGAVWILPKNFRWSILMSSGFRNPNIDDIGKTFEATGGTLIIPNPDLQPEQIYYQESGISKTVNKKFIISITVFNSMLTKAIVVKPFSVNGKDSAVYNGTTYFALANTNIGRANLHGFSTQFTYQINKHFYLKSSSAFTAGTDITNDIPLDHIPPIYGNFLLGYSTKKNFGELYLNYNGWKHIWDYSPSGEDNPDKATSDGTPAWWTLNIKTSYKLNTRWQMQGGVENILDKNYRSFASGINAGGINFILALRYEK